VTENNDVRADQSQPQTQPMNWPAPDAHTATVPAYAGAQPPMPYGGYTSPGELGTVRSTGTCFALMVVTLGFYSLYWFYKTHDEMKRHTNTGVGGGLALLLGFLISLVMYFVTPSEVGGLYERRGMRAPVSAVTGLWALLLGWFFLVGIIVWFVKVNGALNDYWRSQGAV
jgi:hypothetical protein